MAEPRPARATRVVPKLWPLAGVQAGCELAGRSIGLQCQPCLSVVSLCTSSLAAARMSLHVRCVVVYVVPTVIRALDAEPDAVVLCEVEAVGVASVAVAV